MPSGVFPTGPYCCIFLPIFVLIKGVSNIGHSKKRLLYQPKSEFLTEMFTDFLKRSLLQGSLYDTNPNFKGNPPKLPATFDRIKFDTPPKNRSKLNDP